MHVVTAASRAYSVGAGNATRPVSISHVMIAGAPQVGARIDVARVLHLLGAHVRRRPEERPGARARAHPPGRVHHLRDPEVEELDLKLPARLAREEHVLRLQVAVHDPLRVRRGEPGEDALEDRDRLLERNAPAVRGVRRERHAIEELHHEVRRPVLGLRGLEHAEDVRVDQPLARPPLFEEARQHVHVRDELGAEHLHRERRARRRGTCRSPPDIEPCASAAKTSPIPPSPMTRVRRKRFERTAPTRLCAFDDMLSRRSTSPAARTRLGASRRSGPSPRSPPSPCCASTSASVNVRSARAVDDAESEARVVRRGSRRR